MSLFDSDEIKEETAMALLGFFKQDSAAVQFCIELLYIYHLWDDLIDRDKKRTKDDINKAWELVFTKITRNPFYQKYQYELLPLITLTIMQWHDANVLEAGNRDDRIKAYMLRAGIVQIFCYCAFLIGGLDYYKEVGPEIQRLYQENFDAFMNEKVVNINA